MKRTVSFLLSLVMIIGVLSTGFSAFAADETSGNFGDGLTWNFNSLTDTLSVSGTGSMGSFSSQEEIPWNQFLDKIEIVELGNGVTDVGDLAFGLCSSLKKVSLPEGLKSIGAFAFGYADPGPRNKLTEITIPSSVTSIGECAFLNAALESIVIPNDVETIGDSAFYTETLKEVSMPIVEGISFYDVFYNPEKVEITSGNAVPNEYFYDDHDRVNSLKSVILPKSIASIGNGAFYNCSSLTEITIPSSVTSIGDSAFSYTAVESILIPKSVETIGFGAFAFCPLKAYSVEVDNANYASKGGVLYNSDCSKLIAYPAGAATSFEIPSGVTEIGDAAFYGCVLLTDVTIPNSVTTIGNSAFNRCKSLKSVSIPGTVTSIGDYAFLSCDGLTSIVIPDSVTSIGDSAFSSCDALANVTISDGVESIGDSAFEICDGLTSIVIPDSVTSLGNRAFFYSALKDIKLSNNLTGIGSYTFYKCTGLKKIVIPNSVTSISENAFEDCTSLESVSIPNSVKAIGSSAFKSCAGLTSVVITESVTSIGDHAFDGCAGLTSVEIPESVTSIGDYSFYKCTGLKKIVIPNSVTSIGDSVFKSCDGLTSVVIPESVTSIGDSAFSDCANLANVTIPNSVTSIGQWAFGSCDSLTSIVIPNSVTSIGDYSFANCEKLENVTLSGNLTKIAKDSFCGCTGLASIIIPESVTSIDDCAFEGCTGLTSITIQNSSIKIYYSAFRNCYNLKDIYFAGSPEEWRAIIISDADINGAAVHYSKPCGTHKYKWKYNNDSVYNSSSDYKNGTKTGTCIYCGATITEEAPNTALLRSRGNALVLENSITLATYITKDVVDYYDEVYAEFTRNGKTEKITASKEKLTSGSTVYYIFNYKGISPQAIGDDVSITFYGVKDGIVYCGNSYSYSVANYIKNTLAKSDTSDKLKTLLVDLVYYGEACQIYQNYKADKPLSNILTDEQKGYRSTGELNLTSVKHYEHDEQVDEKIKFAPALRLADSVQIAIAFKIPDDVDMSKIIVSACDSDSGWYDYTFKNNPENFEKGKDGYWYFYFDKLNANQLSKTYFFAIFTGDDLTDDSTWTSISALLYYSVESYAATVKNEKLKAVTDAMMRYGNSAKAYSSK